MFWPQLSSEKIKHRVFESLKNNANYRSEHILGIPGSYLDSHIFYNDAPFLKDAPFLSTLVANPNHIGVHTFGENHEEVFKGTQEIERDLIRLCAEEIFSATPHSYDGYVASGGTEANIQAAWVYRNYFIEEYLAEANEIALVYSEDAHYSMPKAANLLNLHSIVFPVFSDTRTVQIEILKLQIHRALELGYKYFIVVLNLSTTMFGSVDDLNAIVNLFKVHHLNFKVHVDAAFGGFIYPFTNIENEFNFKNPAITSFTLDGHKMLQAPYGTGVFLIRKGYLDYVGTKEANYVNGGDYTLCGSRSGANAISLWMILHTHGSLGWTVKMNQLVDKTNSICTFLRAKGIQFFHNPFLNIISIKSEFVNSELAARFFLVPDTHQGKPTWYKLVIMPHVSQGIIDSFLHHLEITLPVLRK